MTSDGVRVVRGRLPGTSAFGCAGSRENICARVPSGKPSPGMTGELGIQAPLTVAAIMFPSASTASRWVVSWEWILPCVVQSAGMRRLPRMSWSGCGPAFPGRSTREA